MKCVKVSTNLPKCFEVFFYLVFSVVYFYEYRYVCHACGEVAGDEPLSWDAVQSLLQDGLVDRTHGLNEQKRHSSIKYLGVIKLIFTRWLKVDFIHFVY